MEEWGDHTPDAWDDLPSVFPPDPQLTSIGFSTDSDRPSELVSDSHRIVNGLSLDLCDSGDPLDSAKPWADLEEWDDQAWVSWRLLLLPAGDSNTTCAGCVNDFETEFC